MQPCHSFVQHYVNHFGEDKRLIAYKKYEKAIHRFGMPTGAGASEIPPPPPSPQEIGKESNAKVIDIGSSEESMTKIKVSFPKLQFAPQHFVTLSMQETEEAYEINFQCHRTDTYHDVYKKLRAWVTVAFDLHFDKIKFISTKIDGTLQPQFAIDEIVSYLTPTMQQRVLQRPFDETTEPFPVDETTEPFPDATSESLGSWGNKTLTLIADLSPTEYIPNGFDGSIYKTLPIRFLYEDLKLESCFRYKNFHFFGMSNNDGFSITSVHDLNVQLDVYHRGNWFEKKLLNMSHDGKYIFALERRKFDSRPRGDITSSTFRGPHYWIREVREKSEQPWTRVKGTHGAELRQTPYEYHYEGQLHVYMYDFTVSIDEPVQSWNLGSTDLNTMPNVQIHKGTHRHMLFLLFNPHKHRTLCDKRLHIINGKTGTVDIINSNDSFILHMDLLRLTSPNVLSVLCNSDPMVQLNSFVPLGVKTYSPRGADDKSAILTRRFDIRLKEDGNTDVAETCNQVKHEGVIKEYSLKSDNIIRIQPTNLPFPKAEHQMYGLSSQYVYKKGTEDQTICLWNLHEKTPVTNMLTLREIIPSYVKEINFCIIEGVKTNTEFLFVRSNKELLLLRPSRTIKTTTPVTLVRNDRNFFVSTNEENEAAASTNAESDETAGASANNSRV